MTAAKRIILCLWLVLLGVVHAPAAVLDASENRVWEKIGAPSQTRLAESSQVAGAHQENAPPGWGTVSGCCLAAKGSAWTNLPGGVQVRQVGNYWIKQVNPEASSIAQWWGRGSLNAQASGLSKLGDMAPNFLYQNGKLITRDAGAYTPGNFWSTWAKGSSRLGTPFNDIRPRNIGANGIIFDPAKHPIQQGLEAGAAGLGVGVGGWYLYDSMNQ